MLWFASLTLSRTMTPKVYWATRSASVMPGMSGFRLTVTGCVSARPSTVRRAV